MDLAARFALHVAKFGSASARSFWARDRLNLVDALVVAVDVVGFALFLSGTDVGRSMRLVRVLRALRAVRVRFWLLVRGHPQRLLVVRDSDREVGGIFLFGTFKIVVILNEF